MTIAISMFAGRHKFGVYIPIICGLIFWNNWLTPFMILSLALIYKYSSRSIIVSNLLFYAITNFGCWLIYYPLTVKGFLDCYILALPFLARAVAITWLGITALEYVYRRRMIPAVVAIKR